MFTCGILWVLLCYTLVTQRRFGAFTPLELGECVLSSRKNIANNNTIASRRQKCPKTGRYTSQLGCGFVDSTFRASNRSLTGKHCTKCSLEPKFAEFEPDQTPSTDFGIVPYTGADNDEWNDTKVVDVCNIRVEAGDGGDGCLSFRREKHVPLGGANGGNGGPGGNVYIKADHKVADLKWFVPNKVYKADDGINGGGSNRSGVGVSNSQARGKDLYLTVPPGTEVLGDDDEVHAQLVKDGRNGLSVQATKSEWHGAEREVAETGSSSTECKQLVTRRNVAPMICERGEPGTARNLKLVYKRQSDIALIGKPNAGKSSIIKALTKATPKVASYPFSTRFPIYGVMEFDECHDTEEPEPEPVGVKPNQLQLADIPGLIHGSSEGRGLGHDFLRQIERCQILSYVVDASLEDPVSDYLAVRNEVEAYNPELLTRTDLILLNKIDLIEAERVVELTKAFTNTCKHDRVYPLSAKTRKNLDTITALFGKLLADSILKQRAKDREASTQKLELDTVNAHPKRFRVEREAGGKFRVFSEHLERKVKMMRFDLPETLTRLRNMLVGNKVNKRLIKLGIKPGDRLAIGDRAFTINSDDFFKG